MGFFRSHALLLAAVGASVVGSSAAHGQCRLCDTPTTTLSRSTDSDGIALEVETTLDFDRLVIAGQGQGAAVIRPDGSKTAEGALSRISARAMVGSATVHGAPDRIVRVELPRRIDLYSIGGGRIALDDVVSDLPSLPKLDSAGNLKFRFGGRVRIDGDADGEYRGDLPITVEYQ
jgi:Domain of unknown function (DUF4402)